MSTVDMTLLGALLDAPANAYEMKKKMEYRNIQEWVPVSTPAIYKNLVKLHREGYLEGTVVREGEMPEKTIYSVNGKGREYFLQLMKKYSANPRPVYVDFLVMAANLHHLDRETGLQMIADLRTKLEYAVGKLEEVVREKRKMPMEGYAVVDLYLRMYTLFVDWAEDFGEKYARKGEF